MPSDGDLVPWLDILCQSRVGNPVEIVSSTQHISITGYSHANISQPRYNLRRNGCAILDCKDEEQFHKDTWVEWCTQGWKNFLV